MWIKMNGMQYTQLYSLIQALFLVLSLRLHIVTHYSVQFSSLCQFVISSVFIIFES